jgi:hypothetical protein
MFAIFWKQLEIHPNNSHQPIDYSIVESQLQSLNFTPDILESKFQALRKKVMVESKLKAGTENFLKVAVGDQRVKALKELEESKTRLEVYQTLLSIYERYTSKVKQKKIPKYKAL